MGCGASSQPAEDGPTESIPCPLQLTNDPCDDANNPIMPPENPRHTLRRTPSAWLAPEARQDLQTTLDAILTARRQLWDDMLADPLEAHTFGVHELNVQTILEHRLQMLETVQTKIESCTISDAVNEQPLASLGLSVVDLWKGPTCCLCNECSWYAASGYIPLASLLRKKWLEHAADPNKSGAFCIGLNAGPGSGKSTLVQVLLFLLSASAEHEIKVVQIGSDDLYMSSATRKAHGITTRLDPRSMDPAYNDIVHRLKQAAAGDTIQLPRFNKGLDERESEGTEVTGPFDIVLYEGWRVGVPPGALNGSHFDYSELNRATDFLLYIDADPEVVLNWKIESSKRDHEREKPAEMWTDAHAQNVRLLWSEWMGPFIEQHEQPLAHRSSGGADLIIAKDAAHQILKVNLRDQLRQIYDSQIATLGSSTLVAEVLTAAFGRGDVVGKYLQKAMLQSDGNDIDPSAPPSPVSFDMFIDVVESVVGSSGQLAQINWHRYITCMPHTRLAAGTPPGCQADEQEESAFSCASVHISADHSAGFDELVAQLGGPPSFVAVYSGSTEALERCADAMTNDNAFAMTAIQGCTSSMGSVSNSSTETEGAVLFGIRDTTGVYCCSAEDLDPTVEHNEAAWLQAAHNITKAALQSGMTALGDTHKDALPLVLLHATPGYEEVVLHGIQEVIPGAKVFGGSAADRSFEATSWRLVSGRKIISSPGIAICLMWPSVPYSLSLNCLHGDPPDGAPVGTVDQVDNSGRKLVSLDGQPASVVYDAWSSFVSDGQTEEALNARNTLQPLARQVLDVDGKTVRYFPLHPMITKEDDQSIGLFASTQLGESLVCLRGTHKGIVDAVGAAVTQSSSASTKASGALAIYCAGCAMELERQENNSGKAIAGIGNQISQSLPDGCPFVGCFTFGEQGPLLQTGSVHANLMFNLLVFGTNATEGK